MYCITNKLETRNECEKETKLKIEEKIEWNSVSMFRIIELMNLELLA